MKELVRMWRDTRMIVLAALSAAIYAAVLIPFKGGLVIIPGVTEVRPANVFPVIFSVLLGPAAPWGAAIGNLIGDFFGTLGLISIPGFLANFTFGLVGYKLWGKMGFLSANKEPSMRSAMQVVEYLVIAFVASAACGVTGAWLADLMGLIPYAPLATILTINNFLASAVLGPFLILILYPRLKQWGLLWVDVMPEEDISPSRTANLGAWLVVLSSVVGLVVGVAISTGAYGSASFAAGFGQGASGGLGISLGVLPFVVLIFLGAFMSGGRPVWWKKGVEALEGEEEVTPRKTVARS
jgi:energy-coupling factor transport system substrate-specific component